MLIVNGMDRAVVFVLVKVFGGLAYDRRFLKGRYFERFWSPGWRWAFNGMMTKVFTGHGVVYRGRFRLSVTVGEMWTFMLMISITFKEVSIFRRLTGDAFTLAGGCG